MRMPASEARISSTLTRNDLPAPLVAKTTALWFSSAKRSTITGLFACELIPYRTPEVACQVVAGEWKRRGEHRRRQAPAQPDEIEPQREA